ncbi:hypothetical protein HYDPIDRAFT_34803 [Hydnomerulius pinastri MD-312]|uniref:Uncharacterized protein n=1 Tax=Hydnomerulius pinastri MD-312 TaxID=994086 RepID=A0A0C9VWX7_9AGAM|nr:hypothetical protein HYDPIDRAFT_34803 [Hydnomerulius pinastri MD-312]
MSDPITSADQQKPAAVKVKYSAKAKRKRTTVNDTESGEESDLRESDMPEERRVTKSPEVALKAPGTPSGPKVVDVHLPGPSPKRQRRDSEESQPPSKPTSKSAHARGSSTSSIKSSHAKPSSSARPASTKPTSSRRPESPADDADETSSIAESSSGTRVRRSEPERIQYFKDQPACGELEAHRAFCTRCDSWVSLGKQRTYTVRPWELHRTKCDQKPAAAKEAKPTTNEVLQVEEKQEAPAPDNMEVPTQDPVKEKLTSPPSTPANANNNPSSPTSSKAIRRSEAERIAILQADPRAQEVKPHEVFCRSCQKWIKLSINQPYSLANWQSHQQRCSGSTPSSRVATAERKITLLNDPQARWSAPRSVQCAFCKSTVEMDGAVDYDLTKWNEHKEKCTPSNVPCSNEHPRIGIATRVPPAFVSELYFANPHKRVNTSTSFFGQHVY